MNRHNVRPTSGVYWTLAHHFHCPKQSLVDNVSAPSTNSFVCFVYPTYLEETSLHLTSASLSVRNSDPGLRSKHPPPPLRCMPSFFSREGFGTILPRRLMSKCAYKRYYRRFQRVKLRTKNGLRGRLELAKTTLVLYKGDVGLKICLNPFLLPAAFLISHRTPERSHDVPQWLRFR